MIIQIKDIVKKYNMNISGIIHIGAHYGEELESYIDIGISDIMMFEPLKENFEVLKKKVLLYPEANIKKYQVALGNKNSTITMMLASNNLQSSSVLKPKRHLDLYSDIVFDRTEEVEMQKLDDYNCNKFNFINMDVQGYELEVLKGSQETLNHVDYVYCEVNNDEIYEGNAYIGEIDEYLSNYGMKRFETFWWEDSGWGDALYIKVK